MAFTPEQLTQMRKDLGLQADADEATIVAALSEAASSAEITPPNTPQIPEGMTLVETAVLDDLRDGAAAGRSARDELDTQARDTAIVDAIADGRTTPSRREHWENSWAADAEGTRAMLAALAPGLAVPTNEAGHAGEPEATADDALYTSVFGDEKKGA